MESQSGLRLGPPAMDLRGVSLLLDQYTVRLRSRHAAVPVRNCSGMTLKSSLINRKPFCRG